MRRGDVLPAIKLAMHAGCKDAAASSRQWTATISEKHPIELIWWSGSVLMMSTRSTAGAHDSTQDPLGSGLGIGIGLWC